MQSTKLTYFTMTKRGTTTANSIKSPSQPAIEKLLVCGLAAWVKHKAGNHNFPSIKVTLSSELKSSELQSSERSKTKASVQPKLREGRMVVIPKESRDSPGFINQRWATNELKICKCCDLFQQCVCAFLVCCVCTSFGLSEGAELAKTTGADRSLSLHAAEHPPQLQNVCFSTLPAIILAELLHTLPHCSLHLLSSGTLGRALTSPLNDIMCSVVTFQREFLMQQQQQQRWKRASAIIKSREQVDIGMQPLHCVHDLI